MRRSSRKARWVGGNRFRLLENGEEFYPAVFDAIRRAEREVQLETFIWFDDKVGRDLQAVLMEAARRGVHVDVTLDDYGSPDLPQEFMQALVEAGVRVHIFDPGPRILGRRIQMLRRLHRKLVVVDARVAFVGGLNYSADHLGDFGPEAKQDYAVEAHGPIVQEIHQFALKALAPVLWRPRWWPHRRATTEPAALVPPEGEGEALFVIRDNNEHRNDIERHYRVALRAARHEVIIANAYFFPGYRFIKELRRAARRGVQVKLILQGQPDMAIVRFGARLLYSTLLAAGVKIYEYCKRPMHGKIALVDDLWATVGSSNLDPLSLSLNLEANLVIRDRSFNEEVRRRLQGLIDQHCRCIEAEAHASGPAWWNSLVSAVVFHITRNFASWAGALPTHAPRLWSVAPPRPPEDHAADELAERASG